jgi:hypothetical protein
MSAHTDAIVPLPAALYEVKFVALPCLFVFPDTPIERLIVQIPNGIPEIVVLKTRNLRIPKQDYCIHNVEGVSVFTTQM